MPQRSVATNYTFEQQRSEINLLAADFWSHKTAVDNAASTYLKHDGSNDFTGGTLAVPNAFTINSNGGAGTLTISGNLNVTGTTTTVNTTNLDVTDKNITIAKGNTSDATANGAGITIDSGTDITWNFIDANDAWVSSIGVEATTFLKGPYGQFIGSGTPTTGQGVEVNAPDANTGQIISYDRGGSAYKDLRIKGAGIDFYAGSTNAIVGGFHNTGLIMQSGKSIACGTIVSTMTSPDPFNTVQTNLTLVNGAGNQGAGSKIDFTCGNGKAHIQTLVTGGNSDSGLALIFATSPDNAGADERLRITSDGAIGIGNLQSNQNTVTQSSSTKLYIDSTKFTKIARLGAGSIGSAGWYTVAKISSGQGNYFKCYVSIGGNFTQDMCVMELTGSWSASGGLSNTYTEPVFTAHRTGAHSTDRITKARFAKDSSNATFFQIYIAGGVDSNTFGKSVLEYQIGTYSQNTADSGSEAMFAAVGTPLIEIRTLEFIDNALCTNAGSHKIYTGGTERFRINPTGDVILGFEGNSLYFNNGFNDSNARIQNAGSSNNSNLRFLTRNAGTEAERFRIESDGAIYVGGSGASATAGKLWFNDTSAYSSYIKQIAGSSALSFHTGQSQPERLRIASDGTISKYHNATDISAAFGGSGQVNGVTALPSMAGTPFVVAKDTGTLRSAIFAGNVGINESSPDNKLHITTTSSTAYSTNTNNTQNITNALLKLENLDGGDGTGVNNYVGIQFSVANGANSTAQLNYVRTGDNSGRFAFKARNGGGSDYPNLMDITSDGKVGINETDPIFGQSNGASQFAQGNPKLGVLGSVGIANYSATTTDYSELAFYRRTKDEVQSDGSHRITSTSNMGRISWYGASNDTAFPNKAYTIECVANGADWWAGSARRGYISFKEGYDDDETMRLTSSREIDTGSKTISGGDSLAIQNFRVKGIWSGSPSIGKEIELISGYDGTVKMAAIGYNLTDTTKGSTYGGDLVFHTQPLYSSPLALPPERMRISSKGYVLVNTDDGTDEYMMVIKPNLDDDTRPANGLFITTPNGVGGGVAATSCSLRVENDNNWNGCTHQIGADIIVDQQLTAQTTALRVYNKNTYGALYGNHTTVEKNLASVTDATSYYSNIITTNSGGTAFHFHGQNGGSDRIKIYQGGDIQNTNNSYGQLSDVKLKENIVDANSQWDDIKAVKVRNFNFTEASGFDTHKQIGVVAQEIETVSPGLVTTDNDITVDQSTNEGTITGTTKRVSYSVLYMKSIKALQEAMTRIETLESEVAALKSA